MAYPYLAWVAKTPTGLSRCLHYSHEDFDCLFRGASAAVFAGRDCRHLSFREGEGVLIGELFREPGAPSLKEISASETNAIAQSTGMTLIQQYWGAYVAFILAENDVHVIRDPSGEVPCYYYDCDDYIVITSDPELALGQLFETPAINWQFIAHHLRARYLRPPETGLEGITELVPGQRLVLRNRQISTELVWQPWCFAARSLEIRERPQAIAQVRSVVAGCVASRAARWSRIMLALSGGLDSSIVAASLHAAQAQFVCLTLRTADPAGDEAAFAAMIADHFGVELISEFEDVRRIEIGRSAAEHLPRPIARSFAQSGDSLFLEHARRTGADVFFGGGGGDNVFCHLSSARPMADRMIRHGTPRSLWETAHNLSLLNKVGLFEIMKRGVAIALRESWAYAWPQDRSFLSDLTADHLPLSHPWLKAPGDMLPGKYNHIAWILGIQNHLEGYGRERFLPKISPLMSQPIMETCLRVPTWLWCDGGEDRAIARAGFADLLPAPIRSRRVKGSPGPFLVEIFEKKRAVIKDMLLGGVLASVGFLDVNGLEAALSGNRPVKDGSYSRILAILDVEVWLRGRMTR